MFFVVSKENADNQKIFLAHSPPDFPELGEAIPGAIPGDGAFSTPPMQNQKNGKKKQFPECLPDFARNPGWLSHVIPAVFRTLSRLVFARNHGQVFARNPGSCLGTAGPNSGGWWP